MLVVNAHATQAANDRREIVPVLDEALALPGMLGRVESFTADTGHFSAANVKACAAREIEPMLAMGRESHHVPLLERFAAGAPAPETDDPVAKRAHRPGTQAGRARYGLRKQTMEPVSGSSSA